MQITKYAHACLLIEENGVRIIADPGNWNPLPDATDVAAVLITHEHGDHCDEEQIKQILAKNPSARVISHAAVAEILGKVGVTVEVLEEGSTTDVNGVSISSHGHDHAIIYGDVPPCRNSGYLIGGTLFLPGDALHTVPPGKIAALALPVGGPWMKLAEAIDYAKSVAPALVFPIHDAMYQEMYRSMLIKRIIGGQLEAAGITFHDLPAGGTLQVSA